MQILKDEIRERIRTIAEDSFYEKGFRETTTRAIANEVGISVSNLYLYFQNKEVIFHTLVDGFCASLLRDMERFLAHDDDTGVEPAIAALLQKTITTDRKKFIIVAEKSQGTKYGDVKDRLIAMIQGHIERQIKEEFSRDPVLPRIIAQNFVEGILLIAKEYTDAESLESRLRFFAQYHMSGMRPFF